MTTCRVPQIFTLLSLLAIFTNLSAVKGYSMGTFFGSRRARNNLDREDNQDWKNVTVEEWEKYKTCQVKRVCSGDQETCENGVSWENLTAEIRSAKDVDIIDVDYFLVRKLPGPIEVDDYRQELCYPAFVIHDKKEKCRARIAENRCPWITESEYIDYANHNYSSINGEFQCEPKHVGTEADLGHHPKNCEYGPGWKGILKATNETGRYMIDWTSLVKQQSCVEWVHIIDKQTGLSKDFWTPRNDVNMPIEYAKTTCEMNIFIYGHEKCYSVNTKVPCKKEETKEEEKTATFETIGIVCAVVFPIAVLVVIFTFLVQKKDLRQNSEQKQELNDQYGRYYQVIFKMHLLLKLILQPIFPLTMKHKPQGKRVQHRHRQQSKVQRGWWSRRCRDL